MRAWLERNKIIFETIVAATLTVMGVLVSIAAVFVAVNANKLVDRQNELIAQQYGLERYGTEPVFTVEWEEGEDGLPYYVIKNTGAEIHGVTFSVVSELRGWFKCQSDETKVADTYPRVYIIRMYSLYDSEHDSEFDEQSQSFQLSAYRQFRGEPVAPYDNIFADQINKTLAGSLIRATYISLYYKNYRNEQCESTLFIGTIAMGAELAEKVVQEEGKYEYGKDFWFQVRNLPNDNIWESSEDNLVVEIWGNENPVEKLQEELSIYLSKYNLTLI